MSFFLCLKNSTYRAGFFIRHENTQGLTRIGRKNHIKVRILRTFIFIINLHGKKDCLCAHTYNLSEKRLFLF